MGTLFVAVIGALVLLLIVVAGSRMLSSRSSRGSGIADAFGNFIDVFDPGRSRGDRDLQSQKHRGHVAPSPDDEDPPMVIDLEAGRANVVRPRNRPGKDEGF